MPQDPQLSGVGVVALALLSHYAPTLVAAVLGALVAVGATSTATRWQAARLLVVLVGIAVVFTGFLAWWVEERFGLPAAKTTPPIAFVVAWLADRLPIVKDRLLGRLLGRAERAIDEV